MNSDTFLTILFVLIIVTGSLMLYALHRALQEARAKRRTGPIVVCVDRSGSMYGPLDMWVSILTMEFLHEAKARKRDFHVLYFNHKAMGVQYMAQGIGKLERLPVPNGGTAFEPVLKEAIGRCVPQSNIVVITDGVGERDPQLPQHDLDVRVDAVEITSSNNQWPLPFAETVEVVDRDNLPHPPDLVRKIAKRF